MPILVKIYQKGIAKFEIILYNEKVLEKTKVPN